MIEALQRRSNLLRVCCLEPGAAPSDDHGRPLHDWLVVLPHDFRFAGFEFVEPVQRVVVLKWQVAPCTDHLSLSVCGPVPAPRWQIGPLRVRHSGSEGGCWWAVKVEGQHRPVGTGGVSLLVLEQWIFATADGGRDLNCRTQFHPSDQAPKLPLSVKHRLCRSGESPCTGCRPRCVRRIAHAVCPEPAQQGLDQVDSNSNLHEGLHLTRGGWSIVRYAIDVLSNPACSAFLCTVLPPAP